MRSGKPLSKTRLLALALGAFWFVVFGFLLSWKSDLTNEPAMRQTAAREGSVADTITFSTEALDVTNAAGELTRQSENENVTHPVAHAIQTSAFDPESCDSGQAYSVQPLGNMEIPDFPVARVMESGRTVIVDESVELCQFGAPVQPSIQEEFWNGGPGPVMEPLHGQQFSSGLPQAYQLPWQAFAQGDFVEPARQAFSPEYRVRVGDELSFIYQVTRTEIAEPYRLSVGDVISIDSDSHDELRRPNLTVMPDGTISVSPLQSVYVAGMTFIELKEFLQERFAESGLRSPRITVLPVQIDLPNRDLRDAVDGRGGIQGGQRLEVTVTWDGYIWLPKVNAVPVVGLSLAEISREVNARYASVVPGIELTPILNNTAPALVYVVGEVGEQGRVEIRRPTTALQAITQAGGHNPGANMRDVIILRRTSDWRLIATRVNLHESAWGRGVSCDDIWLHDSDIVIVPRSRIERIAELVELYFTRSLYGVLPNQGFTFSYNSDSTVF